MYIENETLYIDTRIDFEECEQLLQNSKESTKIIVQTNDIHPAAMQILFCLSKEKQIEVEDSFNQRLFENLKFTNE